MSKLTDLQVDHDQRFEPAEEEEQIHAVPLIIDPHTPLPSDKREVISEFEEKVFEAANERRFEIGLGVLIVEIQER